MAARAKTLRRILGDPLNAPHSWFKQPDGRVTYVILGTLGRMEGTFQLDAIAAKA